MKQETLHNRILKKLASEETDEHLVISHENILKAMQIAALEGGRKICVENQFYKESMLRKDIIKALK